MHHKPSPPCSPIAVRSCALILALVSSLLATLLTGCNGLGSAGTQRVHQTHWRLIAIEEEPVPPAEQTLLRITDKHQIFGQMGTTRYFGSYGLDSHGSFRVRNLAPIDGKLTETPSPGVLRYLGLLLVVDRLRVDLRGQLVLRGDGKELLRYEDSLRLRSVPEQPDEKGS